MIRIQSSDDIYPAIEELIILLKNQPASKLSAIIDHRMHKVSWTTRNELLEEIHNVLKKYRGTDVFDASISRQLDQIEGRAIFIL